MPLLCDFTNNGEVDTERLRNETRREHESTESTVPLMGPDLTRERYVRVLRCMYGVVQAWEAWASAHAPAHLAGMVRERNRGALLQADLLSMSTSHVGADTQDCVVQTKLDRLLLTGTGSADIAEARFLGAMYVMEGSRLGGRYIAKHVEKTLGLQPGLGNAYFRGHGEQTGALWQGFKRVLADVPDELTDEVIAAAKAMFGLFAEAMRPCADWRAAEALAAG